MFVDALHVNVSFVKPIHIEATLVGVILAQAVNVEDIRVKAMCVNGVAVALAAVAFVGGVLNVRVTLVCVAVKRKAWSIVDSLPSDGVVEVMFVQARFSSNASNSLVRLRSRGTGFASEFADMMLNDELL